MFIFMRIRVAGGLPVSPRLRTRVDGVHTVSGVFNTLIGLRLDDVIGTRRTDPLVRPEEDTDAGIAPATVAGKAVDHTKMTQRTT